MVALLHLWNIAVAYLWYRFLQHRIRYTVDKQNAGVLFGFFFAGILSVLVTFLLHFVYPVAWFFGSIYESEFLYQVLVTGVVEEWAKWLCFILAVHGGGSIKEPQDGILQAAAVGLGFATVENILYIGWYQNLGMALRPLISTGGHMIYAAFWGASYSAAVYSNTYGKDPQAYRLAVISVFLVALVHGSYNALLSTRWPLVALLPDAVLLGLSVFAFFRLVDHSPYRRYGYGQARAALQATEKGLFFNRKSTILNRRQGLFRMYLGEYKGAAASFGHAMPRAKSRAGLRFFKAVCEFAYLGGSLGKRSLRNAWAPLSDAQRRRFLEEVAKVLRRDRELFEAVARFLQAPFLERRGKEGHALAKELKMRKARRRGAQEGTLAEVVAELSREEKERLARRWRQS